MTKTKSDPIMVRTASPDVVLRDVRDVIRSIEELSSRYGEAALRASLELMCRGYPSVKLLPVLANDHPTHALTMKIVNAFNAKEQLALSLVDQYAPDGAEVEDSHVAESKRPYVKPDIKDGVPDIEALKESDPALYAELVDVNRRVNQFSIGVNAVVQSLDPKKGT